MAKSCFHSPVQKLGIFLKYWLVLVLWMSLIFVGSSDTQSFPRSSRIVEPILRWLFPKVSDQTVHNVVFVARKGAHLTEYAILAMLIWRAVRMPTRGDRRPWLWKHFWIALGIAAF